MGFNMSDFSEPKVKEILHSNFFEVSLNRPRKINVLDEELVEDFQKALNRFEENGVKNLLITGEGEKGFCAGGDVVSVIEGIKEGRENDFFFKKEYELDQRIHHLENSTGFAHGIVMGGGMGILMGCSSKILDPGCMLAMPEVTIGFFPDVGASYFLQNIPKHWRVFLTQTGARLNAIEAFRIGLVNNLLSYDLKKNFLDGGLDLEAETKQTLSNLVHLDEDFKKKDIWLKEACDKFWNTQKGFDDWVFEEIEIDHPLAWMNQSLEIYKNGSPVSKVVTWELFNWCEGKTIEECFKMDLKAASFISDHGDFEEGVRALLIDKDKNPKWKDSNIFYSRERIKSELEKIF